MHRKSRNAQHSGFFCTSLGEDCATAGVGEDHTNHDDDRNPDPDPLDGSLGALVKKKTHVVSRIMGKSGTIIAYFLCSLVSKTH